MRLCSGMYINRIHAPKPALLSHAAVDMLCLCLSVKTKSPGKQPLGKTLRIVLQPGDAPPGTVNSLSGTSAGHIQTH